MLFNAKGRNKRDYAADKGDACEAHENRNTLNMDTGLTMSVLQALNI
jgi:hypothetical protein